MQLPFNPRKNLRQIFATPLGSFEVPGAAELMPKIARVVLAKEKAEKGMNRSNKGGWHSEDTLLNWKELEFADLADTFRSSVAHMIASTSGFAKFNVDLTMSAWANVNRAGAFNSPHIHPNNHWSGVLYVQAPNLEDDPFEKAGNIEIQDPRGPINMVRSPGQKDALSIEPKQGMILIFPSWLLHCVNSFSKDVVRISIAFNARINQFQVIKS
ncbi:MAG: hypothetical protein HKN15_00580 [Xanthomonadales bacterium]|nr:hypothetical protein [Xanthomonadales bacterium]